VNSERFTQFLEQKDGDTPLNLWERMYPAIPNPRSETYVSTPFTSGPAKAYIATKEPQLAVGEVTLRSMQANSKFLDDALSGFPSKNKLLTIPYHIGKRDGWGEVDYNGFWMSYLSGISPREAAEFNDQAARRKVIQADVFNDHAAPTERRLEEYQKLVDAYGTFVEKIEINPVSEMVFVPGYEDSLGCTAEKLLAERLKIRQMFVVFDSAHHEYERKVEEGAPWLKGHPQIKENGGETLVFFAASL